MKSRLDANYWKLWIASVTSNFGDGLGIIAYPWLASTITRDGFKLGLVVLAGRLPWLLFSLPAGVITDRVNRKWLMVGMDTIRTGLTLGVAVIVLMNEGSLTTNLAAGTENLLLGFLVLATFLLGMAEVLRDNAAQTFLPAIVDTSQLETANGRLWGAEMVMNSFAGPPAAGVLIGIGLAFPFFVDAGTFAVAASLILLIRGDFSRAKAVDRPSFRAQLKEGFGWLWRHPFFRPLAITLGIINALSMMATTTMVLFVQEILGLEATAFGALMTAGAVGGVVGSFGAPRLIGWMGKGPTLFVTLLGGAATMAVTGITSSAIVVWVMFAISACLATLWNVITVSLRQRVIPDDLLGRVNSVYRFFGWGMMSIGALVGGAIVSVSEPMVGREMALRLPFLISAVLNFATWLYALPRLNSARIAETEAAAQDVGV